MTERILVRITVALLSAFSAPLCKGSWHAVGVTEGLYPRPVTAFTPIYCPTIFLRASVSGAKLTPFLL